jgi:hypothetical protein
LTYVVEVVQDLWLKGQWNLTALIILAGLVVVSLAVSVRTFRWEWPTGANMPNWCMN